MWRKSGESLSLSVGFAKHSPGSSPKSGFIIRSEPKRRNGHGQIPTRRKSGAAQHCALGNGLDSHHTEKALDLSVGALRILRAPRMPAGSPPCASRATGCSSAASRCARTRSSLARRMPTEQAGISERKGVRRLSAADFPFAAETRTPSHGRSRRRRPSCARWFSRRRPVSSMQTASGGPSPRRKFPPSRCRWRSCSASARNIIICSLRCGALNCPALDSAPPQML